jgi:hypothetical protein
MSDGHLEENLGEQFHTHFLERLRKSEGAKWWMARVLNTSGAAVEVWRPSPLLDRVRLTRDIIYA